jgi:DNA-binding transcriptional ArsR family regulator
MDTMMVVKILRALSNPNRLELYFQIARNRQADYETGCGCFVSDLIGSLNIGAPTVSHHLKELANAGLITTRRHGKFLTARVNEAVMKEVSAILSRQG